MSQIVIPGGAPTWLAAFAQSIQVWMDARQYQRPMFLPAFTVATAPTASRWTNCAIIVSNESGGRTIATSDGTNWKRVKDGANIS